jgi:UDP-N-acetylglucosamine 1-carboxyvinyltransferase
MPSIQIRGGLPLHGTVRVEGAKNSALKLVAAALLAPGASHITNVPDIADIDVMCEVVSRLGAHVEREDHALSIDATDLSSFEAPYDLVARMRASISVLGPLVARLGRAHVAMPGGCNIGSRKIDMHIRGLSALGVDIEFGHGFIDAGAAVAAHTPGLAAAKPAQIEAAKGRVDLVIARNGSSVPEIYFSLPKAGQAKVELFDVAGRKVAELFNGQANAGVTRATWSAGSLHQGAYFARLTAGGVQTARQLMLLGE